MKNKFKGKAAFYTGCVIAMFLVVSLIVMQLWNCLLPEILGVKAITFWQAAGILVLSKILFGGFHGKKGFGQEKWKQLKEERMNGMSEEEKEKLKEAWEKRCDRGFFKDRC